MSKVVQLLLFLSAFGLSPLALSANYTLYIEDGYLTINGDGGDVINVWGYTDANGAPPMVPGPILEARQGEATSIKVVKIGRAHV